MRRIWLLLAACAVCAAANPEYHARRQALAKALPDGVVALWGLEDNEEDVRSAFFQEPDFYYLTGWNAPGAALLMDHGREILFLPKHNAKREPWTGRVAAQDDPDIRQVSGFEAVQPPSDFEPELRAALERGGKLYADGKAGRERVRKLLPSAEPEDVSRPLARLRMRKSTAELALIERAADASIAAHRAAWKRIAPGLFEYQIAATMVETYTDRGCERSAYAPIVGSGPNAAILHYAQNTRQMKAGDLVVMDVAGEYHGYAADITRTAPVSGHFTARQRELYDIVLGAEKAVISAVKPGMRINRVQPSLFQVALDYLNTHGRDSHGEPLGKYFIHGISHHIGLDVHDASDNNIPLEEGMVISVEPGLYIPEENIGIRIEDMVLVTANGARVLTAALPREAAEIERAMRK
jgi:Xaa-Pro aminopeptidase